MNNYKINKKKLNISDFFKKKKLQYYYSNAAI